MSSCAAAFPGVRFETGQDFAGGRACLLDLGMAARDAGYAPRYDVARALADVRRLGEAGLIGG